jgi:hypothetical protein
MVLGETTGLEGTRLVSQPRSLVRGKQAARKRRSDHHARAVEKKEYAALSQKAEPNTPQYLSAPLKKASDLPQGWDALVSPR